MTRRVKNGTISWESRQPFRVDYRRTLRGIRIFITFKETPESPETEYLKLGYCTAESAIAIKKSLNNAFEHGYFEGVHEERES